MKYLFIPLLLLFQAASIYAQEKISVTFQASDGKIEIFYELNSDANLEYDVGITLRRTSDASYVYFPSSLAGDVGRGKFGAGKRKATWNLRANEADLFDGDDFYFEVTANPIEVKKGSSWYYYVGGVLLGGGAAAVLLLNKKDASSSTSGESLPTPPGRPK